MRKELNDVAESVFGKRRFLVRFQDGCGKDLTLNQLTKITVERIPNIKESKVTTIYTKPE